jgi:hypothetical protein
MHHTSLVIDFDQPTARAYVGSFNFSKAADRANGENLTLIKDRRIATSFMIEAVRIFDHYAFRMARAKSRKDRKPLNLQRTPRAAGEKPWWDRFYTDPRRRGTANCSREPRRRMAGDYAASRGAIGFGTHLLDRLVLGLELVHEAQLVHRDPGVLRSLARQLGARSARTEHPGREFQAMRPTSSPAP